MSDQGFLETRLTAINEIVAEYRRTLPKHSDEAIFYCVRCNPINGFWPVGLRCVRGYGVMLDSFKVVCEVCHNRMHVFAAMGEWTSDQQLDRAIEPVTFEERVVLARFLEHDDVARLRYRKFVEAFCLGHNEEEISKLGPLRYRLKTDGLPLDQRTVYSLPQWPTAAAALKSPIVTKLPFLARLRNWFNSRRK